MFIPIWLLILIVFLIAGAISSAEERADSAESELSEREDSGHYESDYDDNNY